MTNINRPGPAFSPNALNDKLNMIQLCEKSFVGVPQLLIDLQRLSEDKDTADTMFIVDRDEERIYAHKFILQARYVFVVVLTVPSSIHSISVHLICFHGSQNPMPTDAKVFKHRNEANSLALLVVWLHKHRPGYTFVCHMSIQQFFDNSFCIFIPER